MKDLAVVDEECFEFVHRGFPEVPGEIKRRDFELSQNASLNELPLCNGWELTRRRRMVECCDRVISSVIVSKNFLVELAYHTDRTEKAQRPDGSQSKGSNLDRFSIEQQLLLTKLESIGSCVS